MDMKFSRAIISLSVALLPFGAAAQTFEDYMRDFFSVPRLDEPVEEKPVSFDYNLRFDFAFINNEYDSSNREFSPSQTIGAVRISPYVGVRVRQGDVGRHRVMVGVDVLKDFGAVLNFGKLFVDFSLWYQFDGTFGKNKLSAIAGIYPRHLTEGRYTSAIYSDYFRFYDNNFEGVLLKWRRPKAFYEIGLDWNGRKGPQRRERFNVFTSADAAATSWLRFGWQGMFQHYACTDETAGIVVDECFLNPYMTFDFAKLSGLQALSLTIGPFVEYENDRRFHAKPLIPVGGDAVFLIRNWNVSLRNEFYYGQSMTPFWRDVDGRDEVYANNLYYRDAFWQITLGDPRKYSWYDILEASWTPHLTDFLDLKLAVKAHFLDGPKGPFAGWQQIATLTFDLQSLLSRDNRVKMKAAREKRRSRRLPVQPGPQTTL